MENSGAPGDMLRKDRIRISFYMKCPQCGGVDFGGLDPWQGPPYCYLTYKLVCPMCDVKMIPEVQVHPDEAKRMGHGEEE